MIRYPGYKDSGIQWLGDIPEHWEIKKVKYITNLIIDGTHVTPTYVEKGVRFLRVTDIQEKNINSNNIKFVSEQEHQELIKRCKPEKGDLLLSKNGTIGITRVIDWDFPFSIFVSLCLIKFKKKLISPHFFSYFFQSSVVDRQICESSKRTSVTNLHLDKIKELLVVLPEIEEQLLINRFLDHKTAQLDELISKKERMIELLNEERAAVIDRAVTKGLDDGVTMKDSGIPWLGEIPEHWEIKKIKYTLRLGNDGIRIGPFGSALKIEVMKSEGYNVYGQENVIKDNFEVGFRFIDDEKFNELKAYKLIENDIIITMMGTTGKSKVFPAGCDEGIMDSHLIRLRTRKTISPFFISILINSSHYIKVQIKKLSKGSIMEGLNSMIIKNLKLLLPPMEEQLYIVSFIERKTEEIDNTITKIKKEIELLKEYRTALITEAVTGKIDVTTSETR